MITSKQVATKRSAVVKPKDMLFGTVNSICLHRSSAGLKQAVELIHHDNRVWVYTQQAELEAGALVRFDPAEGLITPLPSLMSVERLEALYQTVIHPEDLDRLLWLIEEISHPVLQRFMVEILQDQPLASAWVRIPASCGHHHSEPGGLLRHTVECGEWVQQWATVLPEPEASLTLVAMLCHDLGKTRTITVSNRPSDTGRLVSHEIMGLQILQPFLDRLRKSWAKGADALIHMLSWFPTKQEPLPRLPGLVMLKHADQLSTVMDLRARAFDGHPSSHFWNKPNIVVNQRFHQIA